ncbi:hypothetical protein IGB42_01113 [Andreprevotia sp. IGB-42]|uniref:GNAT family N-acetyltransferase n=1 Tax=Andreprevotia sp. IGB-42 TaxID=2497473 RepID=UPI00135A0D0E|nr:GNAT family N-acetyltransferase [Andreprevotia sp. IGB-42]KAF0814216.1 hypothetical protein IGB42_01113 [Andreprevotia sp. IGB-42]
MNEVIVQYSTVNGQDFEALLALRIAAMRASLEQVGRFDPERARQRFAESFDTAASFSIDIDGQWVGFYTLRPVYAEPASDQTVTDEPVGDALGLDHLYLHPDHSGRGVGSMVMARLIAISRQLNLPIRLGALRGSAANRFYQRHGFTQCGESEWDILYERMLNAV